MESFCVRYTDLPHTSRLFADYLYHFDRAGRFYAYDPGQADSYEKAARAIEFPDDRRSALVAALREQNGNHALLDVLARPGAAAVVTGQQVGLFSGPCYSIYKALTAVKLAGRLTARGIPTVPVFWLATEDHDFAEVNHAWIFDGAQQPVQLAVSSEAEDHTPVGGIRLLDPPAGALRHTLRDFPFGEEVAAIASETYGDGRTMGQAFTDLLRRILGGHAVLTFDPMHPASRKLAAPALARAVAASADLKTRLLERNRELEEAGYHAQVHVEPATSFFFLLEGGRRLTLRRQKQEWVTDGRRFSADELAARAEQLSPNALLRPVVQDSMIPTVAYVGGPAELAYLAQSQVIYRELLGRMPVAVPRAGFTLLDARAHKLKDRYRLKLSDCLEGRERLETAIAERLVPPSVAERLRDAGAAITRELEGTRGEIARFDPTLASALDKSRAKMLYQLAKSERKLAREMLRRSGRAREEAAYLAGLISPNKHLQERFYTILPFLAKHGLDLPARLYENVHLDCPDHLLMAV